MQKKKKKVLRMETERKKIVLRMEIECKKHENCECKFTNAQIRLNTKYEFI